MGGVEKFHLVKLIKTEAITGPASKNTTPSSQGSRNKYAARSSLNSSLLNVLFPLIRRCWIEDIAFCIAYTPRFMNG
jgi:hypothetical protein